MSEVRENGPDASEENGWVAFTVGSASNRDYDIACRINPDYFEGMSVSSLIALVSKQVKHVLDNERSSAGGNRNVEKFPNREDFERTWAQNKRQAIVDGTYAEGGRVVGPRLSPYDKEVRRLIDVEYLQPTWIESGETDPFPTSGKAKIRGTTLDNWRKLIAASPKPEYETLRQKAKANVESAKERAAQARAAAGGQKTDAFAALLA